MKITDEMVTLAVEAHMSRYDGDPASFDRGMRAALEAVAADIEKAVRAEWSAELLNEGNERHLAENRIRELEAELAQAWVCLDNGTRPTASDLHAAIAKAAARTADAPAWASAGVRDHHNTTASEPQEPAQPTSSFKSQRVVPKPGSGLIITALELTPEAAAGLCTHGVKLPVQPAARGADVLTAEERAAVERFRVHALPYGDNIDYRVLEIFDRLTSELAKERERAKARELELIEGNERLHAVIAQLRESVREVVDKLQSLTRGNRLVAADVVEHYADDLDAAIGGGK